ncbi:hypothetical protein VPH35_116294 [Triticum aestivum]
MPLSCVCWDIWSQECTFCRSAAPSSRLEQRRAHVLLCQASRCWLCKCILEIGVKSRCFPNLETLIVESFLEENTSNRSLKFWQETSPIECVQSHLKTLSFCELQGNDDEFDFIMFIVENALKLERLIIQIKQDLTYTERQVVVAKLGDLSCANWANTNCKVRFEVSTNPIGSSWSIEAGSDLSSDDPFSCL